MAGCIYINDHEYPAYDRGPGLTISTNVNAGRNSLGEFVGQRVGRDQDKIDDLQWSFLDAATWSAILKEFDEFIVLVRFPDMKNNTWKTERMYPGNRTAKIWEIGADGLPTMYKDCKVNLIDVGEV